MNSTIKLVIQQSKVPSQKNATLILPKIRFGKMLSLVDSLTVMVPSRLQDMPFRPFSTLEMVIIRNSLVSSAPSSTNGDIHYATTTASLSSVSTWDPTPREPT